jgi:phosphoglycolate phosphatase
MSNGIKHVIWDWNGTLINDGELCVSIVNELLRELSIPSVSLRFYRDNFQFPVRSYYEKIGFPKDNRIHERISGQFIRRYRESWRSCDLQPNSLKALETLKDAGIGQSILSASKTSDLRHFVSEFGLPGYFNLVEGVSHIEASGKAEVSRSHFKEINLPPGEVLLVGDTNHDGEIAKGLKANCLLYTRGHNSEAVLARSGHPLIDDLMQVPARVLD